MVLRVLASSSMLTIVCLLAALSSFRGERIRETDNEEGFDDLGEAEDKIASIETRMTSQNSTVEARLNTLTDSTDAAVALFKKETEFLAAEEKASEERQTAALKAAKTTLTDSDKMLDKRITNLNGQFVTMTQSLAAHDTRLPPNGVAMGTLMLKSSGNALQLCKGTNCRTLMSFDDPPTTIGVLQQAPPIVRAPQTAPPAQIAPLAAAAPPRTTAGWQTTQPPPAGQTTTLTSVGEAVRVAPA
jgi:hypothetical protein